MSEVIDFKTRKIITSPPKPKEEEKQKTISFLKDQIKRLESENLNPEDCMIIMKWQEPNKRFSYRYNHNGVTP